MSLRKYLISVFVLFLTGCSTFRPHVNPYNSGTLWKSCDKSNIESDAQKYADYLRCEYIDVINDRVSWDRGSGMTIMTALGLAGYRGISGGHSSQIAALTTGSAALYGINQLLVNDPVSAVYAAGLQAISCVEKNHQPRVLFAERNSINIYAKEINKTIDILKKFDGNMCQKNVKLANSLLGKYKALAQDLVILREQNLLVESTMTTELSIINSKVIMEVDNRLPNIDGIMAIAQSSFVKDSGESTSTDSEDGKMMGSTGANSIAPDVASVRPNQCIDYSTEINHASDLYEEILRWKNSRKEIQAQASSEECSLNVEDVFSIGGDDKSYSLTGTNKLEIPIFDSSGRLYLARKINEMKVGITYNQSEDIYLLTIESVQDSAGRPKLSKGSYDLYIRDKKQRHTEYISIEYQ